MTSHQRATARLKRKLGPKVVATDAASLREAGFDSSKILFHPVAVVRVRREQDVGVALALANEFRVPVTTRGRGTTLTGAAAPRRGGWVLDTRALNGIAIDGEAGLAHVGAGAVVATVVMGEILFHGRGRVVEMGLQAALARSCARVD